MVKRLVPNCKRIDGLFQDWHGRKSVLTKRPEDFFPDVDFPDVLYPRGGLVRLWYESDKKTPWGDRQKNNYVHCNVIDPVNEQGECVCGHVEHDDLPSSLATVYDGDGTVGTKWQGEPVEITWPEKAVFCGYLKDWDEDRGGGRIHEVRFSSDGWLIALDDRSCAVIRNDGKVYVMHGGQMRVEARGLVG